MTIVRMTTTIMAVVTMTTTTTTMVTAPIIPMHAINTTPGVNIERYGATSDPKIDVKISTRIKKTSINIQAATIHVLGDFIQSIGVFIAAVIIKVKVRTLINGVQLQLISEIILLKM